MGIDLYETKNRYGIIYSDPPWQQKKGGLRKCRPNQSKELDYQTLSLDEIKELHRQASSLCEENHNFFVWTIDKFLPDTEKMMDELGYMLHARIIWDKENGIAPAFTVRFSHEYLLWFYRKGKMLKPRDETRGKYTTILREKATVHSRKPECAYLMLEDMFPDVRKLEMFARSARDGWDGFGNEL